MAYADPKSREAAVRWLQARVAVSFSEWAELSERARAQAFTVAGNEQLQVVQSVLDELTRAVERGDSVETFRNRVTHVLGRDWLDANSARLTTAYSTTTQTAYNAGRFYQLEKKTRTHPYRVYDAVLDDKTTPLCWSLHGHVYRHDDPFLLTHWPPLHWHCRTGVRSLTIKQAMDRARGQRNFEVDLPPGFGLAPPKREVWKPKKSDFSPDAWAEYQRKQKQLKKPKRR